MQRRCAEHKLFLSDGWKIDFKQSIVAHRRDFHYSPFMECLVADCVAYGKLQKWLLLCFER